MDPQINDPQNPGEGTPPVEPPSGNDGDMIERAAYVGLQRLTQKLKDQNTDLETRLQETQGRIAELETTLDTSGATRDELSGQVDGLAKELSEKESRIAELGAELDKWNLVRTEYPDLVQVAHLVPLGDRETMVEGFKNVKGAIASMVKSRAEALMQGALPPVGGSGGQTPTLSDEQIWDNLLEAEAGSAEYRKWSDMWAQRREGKEVDPTF